MADIVMIAPYREMADMARRIAGQFGSSISIVDGNLQEGLDAARDASEHGARVVVSRGGTALLITQASDVCVPVVNIPFISNELVRALRQAVRISRPSGLPTPFRLILRLSATFLMPGSSICLYCPSVRQSSVLLTQWRTALA